MYAAVISEIVGEKADPAEYEVYVIRKDLPWVVNGKDIQEIVNGDSYRKVTECKDCAFYFVNNGNYPQEECKWRCREVPDVDDFCSGAEPIEWEPGRGHE